MWNLLRMLGKRKNENECGRLRDALENVADVAALSSAQQEHLTECPVCQAAADEVLMSRSLLREMPAVAATPAPWFAPRVMAAIAAREAELRHSLEAWAAVPRLAARMTWVTAMALLLAGTWLYHAPKSTPPASGQATVESLFDSPQSPAAQDDVQLTQDDVLLSQGRKQ
jgi:predicted anti-sigma-YlaC factor YlaD